MTRFYPTLRKVTHLKGIFANHLRMFFYYSIRIICIIKPGFCRHLLLVHGVTLVWCNLELTIRIKPQIAGAKHSS